jgi:cytoskeletal protein CcmA (bactofilin family)
MSNPYETAKEKSASVLGPTLKFKGKLSAEEDLLIQGEIEGSIKHTSKLTIGKEGKIKADVTAEYIAVEGSVKGDLKSSQSVTIHESADIDGNIYSPTVSLLEGAKFNGTIDMTGKAQAQSASADKAQAPGAEASEKPSSRRSVSAEKTESKPAKPRKSSADAA